MTIICRNVALQEAGGKQNNTHPLKVKLQELK
jgi:hypothetical protein